MRNFTVKAFAQWLRDKPSRPKLGDNADEIIEAFLRDQGCTNPYVSGMVFYRDYERANAAPEELPITMLKWAVAVDEADVSYITAGRALDTLEEATEGLKGISPQTLAA